MRRRSGGRREDAGTRGGSPEVGQLIVAALKKAADSGISTMRLRYRSVKPSARPNPASTVWRRRSETPNTVPLTNACPPPRDAIPRQRRHGRAYGILLISVLTFLLSRPLVSAQPDRPTFEACPCGHQSVLIATGQYGQRSNKPRTTVSELLYRRIA